MRESYLAALAIASGFLFAPIALADKLPSQSVNFCVPRRVTEQVLPQVFVGPNQRTRSMLFSTASGDRTDPRRYVESSCGWPERFIYCDAHAVSNFYRRMLEECDMAAHEVADILVVGSGAAGGAFAWHLSKVAGLKIICLEQGDWVKRPDERNHTEEDAQRQRLKEPPPVRDGVKYFRDGYPYDYTQSYWQPILGNAVGGGTIHYGAHWARLHPSDFLARTLDGVADDWPIRYGDLAPYYDRVDNKAGIAGVLGDPAYPSKSVALLPPYKLTRGAQVLIRGFKKLGWHFWPIERAVITRPFGGRRPCAHNCTSCDDGCPLEAKNTADVVFWPEAIRNGVKLITRATVREVTIDKRSFVDGALYYDRDGRLQQQKARVVVLACNGIGTPRLLLNSKSARFPNGLANSSGQVGKNLMTHPSAQVIGLFDEDVNDGDELTNGIYSEQFAESDRSRGFARGIWMASLGFQGPVATALGDRQGSQASVMPTVFREPVGGAAIPWGKAHHVAFQTRARHTVAMYLSCDELPDESNRVELHGDLTDDFGIPALKLISKRTDNAEKALSFAIDRGQEVMMAAGATTILTAMKSTAAPGHYLGTTRMGTDPRRFVVDKWGRTHDVQNLFIIDGGVFTTSGSSLPTATIQAIALRSADYIKKNLRTFKT